MTRQENSNTKEDSPVSLKLRRWFLTWNNYTRGNLENLLNYLDYENETKYAIQEETGESSQINHLQGNISFKNGIRFSTLKNLFPGAHWEKTRNEKAANTYCSKEATRTGETYIKENWKKKIVQKKFKTKNFEELYDWQKYILTIIEEQPDDRTIHWFWEEKGCTGKTSLAKYILKYYNNATYSCACKSADILSIADETKNIYILNFTRTQEGFAPYTALEQLKDGLISDSKLKKKSNNIVMDSPHVVVFANWPPDTSKLSEDRWKIINITEYEKNTRLPQ